MSGYINCACRDCFEIVIGEPGALCHACKAAECDNDPKWPNVECKAPGAYGGEESEDE